MELILFILILINVIGLFRLKKLKKTAVIKNEDVAQKNEALRQEINKLNQEIDIQLRRRDSVAWEVDKLDERIQYQKNAIGSAQESFESYCDMLNQQYSVKEQEYNELIEQLKNNYDKIQTDKLEAHNAFLNNLETEIVEEQERLKSIKAIREASILAHLKEEEIKQKKDFYCLPLSQADKNDIEFLTEVKNKLKNPRLVSMLIWTNFFQKNMTTLCNNVLGTKTITGIYKITNQNNQKCYIGQSVNIAERWKTHAKHGLGIDAPANNKLYSDMMKEGIWNFSWELLKECPKEKLNEEERFFIDLYQSNDYGYNMTKGNK